ncbi:MULTISPECIES: hypothetical protein [unclassified Streptomyces]|uniref:hypothetical protein n=1 Tax=unclassified Streptomyces TaxID=2593676 RepID=UPI0004BDC47B|nr:MULTISPECIES: hypothetical protein [unclassified Streptomyces]
MPSAGLDHDAGRDTGPRRGGLREWREWLEYLARCFEAYLLDLTGIEDQRTSWERAARNLILQVVDRTGCGSGRKGHWRQVLTWFLQLRGVAPDVAGGLVDEAIGGRFPSWTGPDTVVVDDIAEQPGERRRLRRSVTA